MPRKLAGHIIDEFGTEIEVWVEIDENSDIPSHVFLSCNDAPVGDFPFNHPPKGDELSVAANRVAAGEAKRLAVMSTYEVGADKRPITWH